MGYSLCPKTLSTGRVLVALPLQGTDDWFPSGLLGDVEKAGKTNLLSKMVGGGVVSCQMRVQGLQMVCLPLPGGTREACSALSQVLERPTHSPRNKKKQPNPKIPPTV